MRHFWEFFTFELRFRRKSLSTYVYFLLWTAYAFFCVAANNFGGVNAGNGRVALNGPWANTANYVMACLFGIIVIAAVFGTTALRDFQRGTHEILFTKPLAKSGYLFGRWTACLVVTTLMFSGLPLGTWLGTLAPWTDQARIGPNHLWWYLQPFLSIAVVQVFVLGTLFYVVGALSRRLVVVYAQGVAFFIIYFVGFIAFSATHSLEHFWSGVLDPVGLSLLDAVTRYWSVADKNRLLLTWDLSGDSPGVFLYNRVLWISVALLALAALWRWFPMSVEALTARRRRVTASVDPAPTRRPARPAIAHMTRHLDFGRGALFLRFRSQTLLGIRTMTRDVTFWVLVALLIVLSCTNGHFAGRVDGTNVWPVTYLMLEAVEGSAVLFFMIVAALYAAEFVWRDRDCRFDGIRDALPGAVAIDWLANLSAIVAVEIMLLAIAGLAGMMMQTIAGYHHYELLQYAKELYLVTLPQIIGLAMFAMFIQTIVSNKFIGHGIVIGVLVLQTVLYNFGLENTLYLPGAVPPYKYSDMNGYGHFVEPIFWSLTYWSAIFALLGVVSIAYTRHGTDTGFRARTRIALRRAPALAPAAAVLGAIAVGSGAWFYYNAHVLNEYLTTSDRRHRQAEYELAFKRYAGVPQPKVTAVDQTIDIDPAARSFHGSGRVTLQNKSGRPLTEVHLSDFNHVLQSVQFDKPTRLRLRGVRGEYLIYDLATPLAPGDVLHLSYDVAYQSHGFTDGGWQDQFAYNGTFFDGNFLPDVGYAQDNELDDPRRRREEHLPELEDMAPRGDPAQSLVNLFVPNSDWITYHAIVSTTADQVAIAPGNVKRQWVKDGRRYAEFELNGSHVQDFYAYLSGRYQVARDAYQGVAGPVNIEVYYDQAHPYNVTDMLAGTRDGLRYFEANFSPFQFNQFRIYEFPRYRRFAQSFAGTIPFSEGIGFITRRESPSDVDLTYFVTAHELAHQWWGHQLVGARVQGSNMMSETLAQYSAYMLSEQRYGRAYMRTVLHHFLDRYLRGRSGELRRERPLALVEREPYVWYWKGGQIMYTLADYIGADRVNAALHDFLMRYRYANADNQADGSASVTGSAATAHAYPDTRQFIKALRAVTPPEYQYLIDDGFERIVLYDNRTLSAAARRLADGRWEVNFDVQARKLQVDAAGIEHPVPVADYIDIGVYAGTREHPKPLHVTRERLTGERHHYTVIVDTRPTLAGIDPDNRLIDRNADDNLMEVTQQ